MGVGKTTIGKKLAKYFDLDFIDIDQCIEKKFNCTIRDYFEKFGETSFRNEERIELERIIEEQNSAIVSVGGGLPCFFDNIQLMNEKGITIYLHRPAKELFQRLKQGKSKRPLIANMSDEKLLEFIEESLQHREKYYTKALFTADRNTQEPKKLAKLILSI